MGGGVSRALMETGGGGAGRGGANVCLRWTETKFDLTC